MIHARRRSSLKLALLATGLSVTLVGGVSAFMGDPPAQTQLPTTAQDFFQPGTQPNSSPVEFTPVQPSINCTFCHSDYSEQYAPFDTWVGSLMAQSARDPIWHATVAIANQDAHLSGEFCIRCHAPGGWLGGRSESAQIEDGKCFGIEGNVAARAGGAEGERGQRPGVGAMGAGEPGEVKGGENVPVVDPDG